MRGGARDTATFLRSKPHICGLTTQIMSFNILNGEKKNLWEKQPDKIFNIFKNNHNFQLHENFLSLPWFHFFVCFFVFKLQLGIFLEWKRMCASLTVSKSKFTTYWAENYQGQAAVSFKGSHVALSFRKPLSLIANIFLLKYKPLNKILKKL